MTRINSKYIAGPVPLRQLRGRVSVVLKRVRCNCKQAAYYKVADGFNLLFTAKILEAS
jgi:hypothetical protein